MGRRGLPVLREVELGEAGGGGRSDALESRRKVLAAARGLFAERGVDGVSMHEVGRAAGVGQGTLYRRFEHKGALCSALLREEIMAFHEDARTRLGGGGAGLEGLGWFLGRLADFNEDNGPLLGAIRDSAGAGRRVEMYRNPFYAWLRATVEALLGQAVEEGEMERAPDPGYLADVLLAALNIDLYHYQRHELGMSRERVVASLRNLLGRIGGG